MNLLSTLDFHNILFPIRKVILFKNKFVIIVLRDD